MHEYQNYLICFTLLKIVGNTTFIIWQSFSNHIIKTSTNEVSSSIKFLFKYWFAHMIKTESNGPKKLVRINGVRVLRTYLHPEIYCLNWRSPGKKIKGREMGERNNGDDRMAGFHYKTLP